MTFPSTSSLLGRGAAVVACACSCACAGPSEPAPAPAPSYTMIDDMEGANGRIDWTPKNPSEGALPGRWVSYADVQCGDLSPVPEWAPDGSGAWSYSELPEAYETFSDVTSEHAARLRTTAPLENTWGAGMGFEFSEPPPGTGPSRVPLPCSSGAVRDVDYPAAPVDLSGYSGLVFWAMAKKDVGATTILVQFQDENTDPRGGICNPVPNSVDACYNGYGVLLTLGDTLTRYEIHFSDVEQNPLWGHRPKPSIFDTEHAYGLVFQVDTPGGTCTPPITCVGGPPELTFDVWIDDLYFVKR